MGSFMNESASGASLKGALVEQEAVDLAAAIRQRTVSAVEVLEAHIAQIEEVNPQLNALVVEQFEQARTRANQIDAQLASGAGSHADEGCQPLLGVPVTIKEMFDLKGTPTTVGLADRRRRLVTRDAVTVRRLKQAGAVVLGKSNVPQLGMLPETDNPVYGRTNNPHDTDRTCGGSSGGDAALLAAHATPLALASDGAGSIRMPSHFCGVTGFKPTGGRLSMEGHWLSTNWPHDWAQPGPMARSARDLLLAYDVLCGKTTERVYGEVRDERERERSTLDARAGRPQRVGIFSSLDLLPAGPTARRAVSMLSDKLEALGMEPVPVELRHAQECWDLFLSIFYAEGLRDMRRQSRGQRLDWRVRQAFMNAKLPRVTRPVVSWLASTFGQPRIARLMKTLNRPHRSAAEYCGLMLRVQAMRRSFERWMERESLDFLAGPVGPAPAFPHGDFYASFMLAYTGIFNVLAMPAGAIPITQVTPDDVTNWAASLGKPRDWCEQSLAKANAGSEGLPFSVQIIGKWWDDRRVLEILGQLDREK